MDFKTIMTLVLGDHFHLLYCLVLMFFCNRNRPLFVLILILACQSAFDSISHFLLKTSFKMYADQYWFLTFIISQSLFIIGILIKQKYFGIKLKIDQIMILTGSFMLSMQYMALVTYNGFAYESDYFKLFHAVGVQLGAIIQLVFLMFAVAESRKGFRLLKGK